MEVAAAATRPFLSKLGELLKNEYGLENRVSKRVKSLETELVIMRAALDKVSAIPRDQLDEQDRIWADKVRELSYDMEDIIDAFVVRVEKGPELSASKNLKNRVKKFLKKITRLFSKCKDLHQIANAIEESQELAKQYREQRERYMLDIRSINANAKEALNVDPRMLALYEDERKLVGVKHPRKELIKKLYYGDKESKLQLRTISIVGFGGLGKTTLAKAVYDKIKVSFDCSAFVPVSRDPNIRNIFKKILYDLDKQKYGNINKAIRDEQQLIDELRSFLSNKRYLIVVDDVWETSTWEIIMCAFLDSSNGSRIITTSRTHVAEKADYVHNMEPLSYHNSKRLLYRRVFGDDYEDPTDNQPCEATEKILNKCVGVPLAIITMASLLVDKPVENWSTVYDSIGFGPENQNKVVDNTRKILLFSYYDLPAHLKTCLLYLSIFPEDHRIEKRSLIWKWVAEGFVHEEGGKRLVEIGEGYFNQLINKNMIQPMEAEFDRNIDGCRIHDMILDLIRILAINENFVKVLDRMYEEDRSSSQSITTRRLAIHEGRKQDKNNKVSMDMAHVRSFNAIACPISVMPPLLSFRVLRVLALEDCHVKGGLNLTNLSHLRKLHHLRYLRLKNTSAYELPLEIGDLVQLQALDILGTSLDLEALPVTVGKLRKLMRLCVDLHTRVPSGVLGNLTSLQELELGSLADSHCPNFIIDLHKLINLRMLDVNVFSTRDQSWFETLVQSVRTFSGIQHVHIWGHSSHVLSSWEGWKPPRQLCHFCVVAFQLRRLPEWVNSISVPNLSYLELRLQDMEARDLDILARISELRYLRVYIEENCSWTVHGGGLFPKLRYCETNITLTFLEGAMPMLMSARLWLRVFRDGAPTDIGLANLLRLNHISISLNCEGATARQMAEVEAAWMSAVEAYPSRPTIDVHRRIEWMSKEDQDKEDMLSTENEWTREEDKDDGGEDEMIAETEWTSKEDQDEEDMLAIEDEWTREEDKDNGGEQEMPAETVWTREEDKDDGGEEEMSAETEWMSKEDQDEEAMLATEDEWTREEDKDDGGEEEMSAETEWMSKEDQDEEDVLATEDEWTRKEDKDDGGELEISAETKWTRKEDKDDGGEQEISAETELTRENDKDGDNEKEMSAENEITCEKEEEDSDVEGNRIIVLGGEGSSWRLITEEELRKRAAEEEEADHQRNYPHSWVFT